MAVRAHTAAQSVSPTAHPHACQQRAGPADLRSAACSAALLAAGLFLAWRSLLSLQSPAAALGSISLSNSFNAASQTGISGAARSAVAGFVAGILHTLAGADHLAALTPLTIGRSSAKAGLFGALWGFGHSTGQLILGLGLILLKERFESFLPTLSRWGGVTVGGSLVFIGLSGLFELWKEHREAESVPEPSLAGGPQVPAEKDSASSEGAQEHGQLGVGLFANGILFGLQPDALFVIVPALTLPSQLAAVAYISMFVVGTVAAMGSYTAVIGATSKAIQERNPWLTTKLSMLASIVALAIGIIVLIGM